MIKVFGHPASTCTRKVLSTLHEIGKPFKLQPVDIFAKGEHKQPEHLARQPFGRVPAIDDNGFALYESRAIIRYLNDHYSGKLVPATCSRRACIATSSS
jgi:glutathione S-transferase